MMKSVIHGSKSDVKYGATSSSSVTKPTTPIMASSSGDRILISCSSCRGKEMADVAASCSSDLAHFTSVGVQSQENQTHTFALGTAVRAHVTHVAFEPDASVSCLASIKEHVIANVSRASANLHAPTNEHTSKAMLANEAFAFAAGPLALNPTHVALVETHVTSKLNATLCVSSGDVHVTPESSASEGVAVSHVHECV